MESHHREEVNHNMKNNKYDIVIVGGGVSGILAAIIIGKYTNVRIALFEQGVSYAKRKELSIDDHSRHIKGMGGAGTLDGGKLCNFPASGGLWRKTSRDLSYWNSFVDHLPLNYSIRKTLLNTKRINLYLNSNTDGLYHKKYESILLLKEEMSSLVKGLIDEAMHNNVEIFQEATLEDITQHDLEFRLRIRQGDDFEVSTDKVILATGRQSANKIQKLLINLPVRIIEQSPDLGIRIEFPKDHSFMFSVAGKDTKIKMDIDDYKLRTFCVCAGGIISPITFDSVTYYDGQFADKVTNKTNLGIMSRNAKLKGVSIAEDYCKAFHGCDDDISLDAFMKHGAGLLKRAYEAKFGQLIESINYFISQLVSRGLISNDHRDCRVRYPSIDKYNPLVVTDHNFETDCEHLYVIGDAAGVSRGYLQSLWSGWCCSHHIIAQIKNCEKYECLVETDAMIRYA
jgi:uncharacterized protein